MKKILVTGGCGYIGTTLIPFLLENKNQVTVYDSLIFNNGDKLIPFISNKNFKFVKGDIRDKSSIKEEINKNDIIIHLAALVGFPICREKGEKESFDVNYNGTKIIVDNLSKDQYILFGSTGSNYGEVKEGVCTEETPLNPLSIYGKSKTEAEKVILNFENSTAFRFATAFGISPRLRLDLLINDLTYKSATEGYAVIYESHFMRTFIHVKDIGRIFIHSIKNHKKMKNNVYNVGSDEMNYSKKQICEIIQHQLPQTYFNYADVGEDVDKRNYIVSYDKIKNTGYKTTIGVEEGIKELIKAVPLIKISNPYYNTVK